MRYDSFVPVTVGAVVMLSEIRTGGAHGQQEARSTRGAGQTDLYRTEHIGCSPSSLAGIAGEA